MKKSLLKLSGFLLSFVCFCLLGTVISEAFPYQLGDLNRIGGVDASDALLVLQYSAGISELDEYQQTVADVNKDRVIASDDALQILKVAARLDVFQIKQSMSISLDPDCPAPEFTVDKIFDVGPYAWTYEVSGGDGITVERTINDLSEDAAPGDNPEQIYRIIVSEYGTYTFTLRLIDTANNDVAEERVYNIQTHITGDVLWDDPEELEKSKRQLLDLEKGEEFIIEDDLFDEESYKWVYEIEFISNDDGITVEKITKDAAEGEYPEQTFKVTAKERGIYRLWLKLKEVGKENEYYSKKTREFFIEVDGRIP